MKRKLILLAALVLGHSGPAQLPLIAQEKGLIGLWTFTPEHTREQTVKDLAGKSDATILGKVGWEKAGKISGLVLDGKTVSVSVREKYQEADFPTRDITAEAWVRVDQAHEWGGIVGIFQDNGAYEKGWLLGFRRQKFSFALKAARGPAALNYLEAGEPFETGQWYHVAGVYDGATQRLYVNGKLAAESKAQTGDIDYPPRAFYQIGAYRDDDEYYRVTGRLHEARVWNRALSADEIAERHKEKATSLPLIPTVRLPRVFGHGMVLQRDRALPVWGWAEPGDTITATLNGARATTTADRAGQWRVTLPPHRAGGPFELVIAGKKSERSFQNVMVGEVWVCSGQSNMQWGVGQSANGPAEIKAARHPNIRLFTVANVVAKRPADDCDGQWQECSPDAVGSFSAVAYYFGRRLHEELKVPIGLVNTSWGGSPCEAWTSREVFEKDPELKPILERHKDNPAAAAGMFNQMIHPLIPFGIRGAIWYQGESNVARAYQYERLCSAMIRDWRRRWGQGDFPFYYVQIAPFNYGANSVACAEFWDAQRQMLALPNTGMAVTTDLGNLRDIHPANKQDVGKRLALWALARTYGRKDLVHSGPLYLASKAEKDAIRITFDHVGGGLASRDGKPLTWFTLAGEDRKFHPAEAVIDGDALVVRAKAVPSPVAVRFAWHGTAQPNFANREGLPASPFRTDDWPSVTTPVLGKPGGKKVLIIGIDGCRPDALLAAKAPHLHGLIEGGAFSDRAQTGDMTASGSGWGSLLTGVWREKHGVRGNNFEGSNFAEFPDMLARLKTIRPASFVASVVHWEPIHSQILSCADHSSAHKTDIQVADAACQILRDRHPDILFVHLDEVDGAGHAHGFDPRLPRYLDAIHKADLLVGRLLKAIESRPTYAREDWLVVVSTDHGGSGKGHGKDIPEHRTIFFIVSGRAAARGRIDPPPAIVDVAPTVFRHLGVAIDPAWRLDGKPAGLKPLPAPKPDALKKCENAPANLVSPPLAAAKVALVRAGSVSDDDVHPVNISGARRVESMNP